MMSPKVSCKRQFQKARNWLYRLIQGRMRAADKDKPVHCPQIGGAFLVALFASDLVKMVTEHKQGVRWIAVTIYSLAACTGLLLLRWVIQMTNDGTHWGRPKRICDPASVRYIRTCFLFGMVIAGLSFSLAISGCYPGQAKDAKAIELTIDEEYPDEKDEIVSCVVNPDDFSEMPSLLRVRMKNKSEESWKPTTSYTSQGHPGKEGKLVATAMFVKETEKVYTATLPADLPKDHYVIQIRFEKKNSTAVVSPLKNEGSISVTALSRDP